MNLKKNEYSQKSKQSEVINFRAQHRIQRFEVEIDGVIQKVSLSKMTNDDGDSVG